MPQNIEKEITEMLGQLRLALGRINMRYFTEEVEDGKTEFELDTQSLSPLNRVRAMLDVVKTVLPALKAMELSVDTGEKINRSLAARLEELARQSENA